ncbi:MAG: DUF2339 domain-containing protein [Deltaproteobacteria bacterium]|nr:DUF2339 domain-containing protein [Deltaproteobacteria bacterium]
MQTQDKPRKGVGRADRGHAEAGRGTLVWGLIGLLAGGALGQNLWAAVSGAGLGILLAAWRRAEKRAGKIGEDLARLDARLRGLEASAASEGPAPLEQEEPLPVEARPEASLISVDDAPSVSTPAPAAQAPPKPVEVAPAAMLPPVTPSGPDPFDRAVAFLRDLLLGGNTVVRVGVLVLLVGVSLLAKWAVDQALFPIEARLASASLIGLALTAVGYRLREVRPGFGTTLQGGGVAALYLVVFFALRIFELLPAGLAFALFVAIAVAGGALAVLQRSQPLIFIGSLGGFLAPILASTGQGNHVVLFSYYLMLNLGIAAVAWWHSWRPLNLLAFVSTYGVATAWGVLRYRPEHFATTEPFLLAYLVLFTGIALLFAWRRPPRLTGLVDGTLVFGTPLVTLLAQARLVQDMDFGMAYSAAGFGLFYAGVASWLWRTAPDTLRRLCEAFIALAVGFGTLAIPFALDDGLTTTMAWSLEGAGLYWMGTRQHRRLPRYVGIALQLLAAMAFVTGAGGGGFHARREEFMLLANARFMACLALGFAGLFIARESYAARERMEKSEWWYTQALAGWALLWWAGGSSAEIDQFVELDYQLASLLALIGASALALEYAAHRLEWLPGRLLAVAALPTTFSMIPLVMQVDPNLMAHGGFLAWPFSLAVVYWILRRLEACEVEWTRWAYAPAFWLVSLVTGLSLMGLADDALGLHGDWPLAAFGLGLLWTLHVNLTAHGDAQPLPYLPLLNPTDVSLAVMALAVLLWWNHLLQSHPEAALGEQQRFARPLFGGLAFVWLNGLLVRSVHQWTDVSFHADALWDSVPGHAALNTTRLAPSLDHLRNPLGRRRAEALHRRPLPAEHGGQDRHLPGGGPAAVGGGLSLSRAAGRRCQRGARLRC